MQMNFITLKCFYHMTWYALGITTVKIQRDYRQNLKQIARKNQTYQELIEQRTKCPIVGCKSIGEMEILVPIKGYGSGIVFLCNSCMQKTHTGNTESEII